MRNVLDKSCTENQDTFYVQKCFYENRAGYEIMSKIEHGLAIQATDDNVIRHTRFACWITKATDTSSECVIIITFLWQ